MGPSSGLRPGSCADAVERAVARHAMQWFVYEGDWHLCHLCHLCRPCHHDMEGGEGEGDHWKVCRGTCCAMGKLPRTIASL